MRRKDLFRTQRRARRRSGRRPARRVSIGSAFRYVRGAVAAGILIGWASHQYDLLQARQVGLASLPTGFQYSNCDEVRSAGLDPLYRSDPGYAEWLDGDGDGIACEPYYGG